jgi:hypothetical protein
MDIALGRKPAASQRLRAAQFLRDEGAIFRASPAQSLGQKLAQGPRPVGADPAVAIRARLALALPLFDRSLVLHQLELQMMRRSMDAVASRESILELLSDVEDAKVSVDECKKVMRDGEEYVDLTALGLGVQAASSWKGTSSTHSVLRRDVAESTWASILMRLSTR